MFYNAKVVPHHSEILSADHHRADMFVWNNRILHIPHRTCIRKCDPKISVPPPSTRFRERRARTLWRTCTHHDCCMNSSAISMHSLPNLYPTYFDSTHSLLSRDIEASHKRIPQSSESSCTFRPRSCRVLSTNIRFRHPNARTTLLDTHVSNNLLQNTFPCIHNSVRRIFRVQRKSNRSRTKPGTSTSRTLTTRGRPSSWRTAWSLRRCSPRSRPPPPASSSSPPQ